jgi:hypothetical protein
MASFRLELIAVTSNVKRNSGTCGKGRHSTLARAMITNQRVTTTPKHFHRVVCTLALCADIKKSPLVTTSKKTRNLMPPYARNVVITNGDGPSHACPAGRNSFHRMCPTDLTRHLKSGSPNGSLLSTKKEGGVTSDASPCVSARVT